MPLDSSSKGRERGSAWAQSRLRDDDDDVILAGASGGEGGNDALTSSTCVCTPRGNPPLV